MGQVPPCLNADEVAFGYNAYSLLKTGRDEYGAFFPLRLKSFEDYKLPLYTFFTIPFITLFGFNDFSIKALNIAIGVAFVPLIYLIVKELFEKEEIAIIASFLVAINPGIYILTRHAHEGVIGALFILLTFYFLIKFLKTKKTIFFLAANISLLLNAFSYQTGRIYLVFFFLLEMIVLWRMKGRKASKFIILIAIVLFSFYFDFKYGLNRVNNLFFLKNPGFQLRLNEYIGEHPTRIWHNKLTEGIREVSNRYLLQLSPEFFLIRGDTNWRFGFENIGLLTPIEYIAFFIGMYFLFRRNERFRYLLLYIFFITPFNNTLTWQDASLIRNYVILFPLLIIIAYGVYYSVISLQRNVIAWILIVGLLMLFIFYRLNSFDIYFNHYPKRAVVSRAWQCGYKELSQYVGANYKRFERFLITERHGQPYIFMLYYLKFDPREYQKQAKISVPDKYGFGQVGQFDKFTFKFKFDKSLRKTVFVGYPDEFIDLPIDYGRIKKVKVGTEEMFWIYEQM